MIPSSSSSMDSLRRLPSPSRSNHIRFRSSSPSTSLVNGTRLKRKRTISESTTLIQTSNREFKHTHTSISSYRNQYKRRTTTTIETKNLRQWVFSSHDCSHLKGVENASKHPYLYYGVPHNYLNWERRKRCIRNELKCYKASILCLQEVDRFSDLDDLLREDGFKGTYKARTGEACDGCAIFWRDDMFTLIHQESIEFRDFNLRDNVAQFCVLKMRPKHSKKVAEDKISKTQTLLIGNMHALFNPRRGDIKMGQIRLFVKKAHTISKEWGNIPVVIAGDLNSAPQSAVYKFLASSELDLLQYDPRRLSGQIEGQRSRWEFFRAHTEVASSWSEEELQLAAGSEGITHLQHCLQLCSAYVGVPGSSSTRDRYGEPLATSYHSKFMGTVDYIWHSKDLFPVGVVETIPIDILRKMRGLPSEEWGSDHLALVCKLAFADDSSGNRSDGSPH
ncbi:hypothetical protein AQUCO_02600281v1 [Aquilegia coerulea]|uniref:Endonuclease/exonuclease/phosphatase domain-containing protein n=1 Tax=Aquilegia coerulea TaxID=218851 RepID=A0A2G5D943_AQUCA|nr:hypothetical protein AQUCO_02600281v1 [Aquilegia coerulea]